MAAEVAAHSLSVTIVATYGLLDVSFIHILRQEPIDTHIDAFNYYYYYLILLDNYGVFWM